MEIKYDIAFTQAVSPALHDAVAERLRSLLHVEAGGSFQVGDVLLAAGKKLRVVGRTWYLNERTPMLEYRLAIG